MIVDTAAPLEAQPVHWTPLTRFLFRFAFLFFFCFLFAFGNGSLLELFPVVGNWISTGIEWPFQHLSVWLAAHLFHVQGIGAHFHPTGSGDTAVQWILQGVFLAFALGGAIVWTILSHLRGKRVEYQMLYAWLRFLLRLTCALFMFSYGTAKLFPMQMAPPSIAILNEPVGNLSPMTLLWISIGLNPWYEMICGAAELMGGVLLLFRRTALAGALLSAFVMTNVLLYNLFFDVPVKIFAANLLLALLFICLPDIKSLWGFFWKHKPSAPTGIWIPPVQRKAFRITTRTIEIVYVVAILVVMPGMEGYGYMASVKNAHKPTDLLGAWHIVATSNPAGALLTPEKQPITDLYVDTAVRAFTRGVDGELWRTRLNTDPTAKTVNVRVYVEGGRDYSYTMPDSQHLQLIATAPKSDPKIKAPAKPFVPVTIMLVRTPVPSHYPLLDRGFHWVNEWGLER
ncbi:MAG: hypothetical protein PW792_03935 [Acidobacteriaceae bacterium]|nr:hypothetical protein [Acidobacteriaceae bacterium]